jgi:LacI family transcriptional regulator
LGITSHDVARLAGVSQPTVSRALRDDARVSEETKRRVREAAVRLNYVPSDVGRALSSGRTRRIGLLVTDLDNEFYAHIIAPMHRELERRGYQLMLHTESGDSETVVERLLANGLDGVILATTTLDAVAPLRLRDRGIPFVYFNRVGRIAEADAATVSPASGLSAGVSRAYELGHRRFGAVLGPRETSTGQEREHALREALGRLGIPLDAAYVRTAPYDAASGDAATASLLALPEPPTVIFCGNDVVAIGALNAAKREGVQVPDELSIVGFDDLPVASWPIVELSTVSYDLAGMAAAAAEALTRRIADPTEPYVRAEFETAFVERRTLGPAPVR